MDEDIATIRERKLRDLMSEVDRNKERADWPDKPIELSDDTFETNVSKFSLLVVDCWAPWCGPCRMIAPIIDTLAKEYKGKVVFGKLNTDDSMKTAGRFGIMSIPTLLMFKEGKLVDKMIGAVPKQYIEERLNKLI